jgi:hypothetical protein
MKVAEYREILRSEYGIDTQAVWATGRIRDSRFSLHCFQAYGPDGAYLGPVILQELNGGRDGILTYIGANANTIADDARALLANLK